MRLWSSAEMEARKSILALKQEMVDAAFAAALERICTMPQADYVAYLAKLAAQAATTGTEVLVFNAKDQARPARRFCAPAGRHRGQLRGGDDRRALPQ